LILTNPLTGDVITTVKRNITNSTLPVGNDKKMIVELPKIALRSGDYGLQINLANGEGDQVYDWVGRDADLPFLSVTSEEKDPEKRQGYVSIPSIIKECNL
jgi:hypothetical protein